MTLDVLLAEDNPEIRSGMRLLLEIEPGVRLVGEVMSVAAALEQARALQPHVLLLDWELPDCTADLVTALRIACPQIKIIALSGRPEARPQVFKAGADVFISKGESADHLVWALRALNALSPDENV